MDIERIRTNPNSSALYSNAVRVGSQLWISGLQAVDGEGRIVGLGDAGAQADHVLKTMGELLERCGSSLAHVVKITIFLVDIEDRAKIGPARKKYFGEHYPASTLVAIRRLSHPDSLLEIEAVAEIPSS